ncbi:MAG: hypothetical protein Q4D38_01660 [Planctomycetia bacterium]|nr:hypothetical protein [Planctomycetia bacterium]
MFGSIVSGSCDLLCAFYLIAVVSLVYAGTRHEKMKEIFSDAFRIMMWISGFSIAVLILMFVLF